ncbi:Protein CBG26983 [Caenorhabditis briggsae]|uniref:Protein CBG26983 n=1 Tax=Caenorhabditis briggsae TaxID=6238 RepID=B6IEU9_CAEBR|nr:Protein CBG26983 [Caenorhabditis briggsae]CAR98429.1 Protein CBG26983 [Caenorhabditis briggsae]
MKAVFGVIEKFIEDRKEWFTPNERLKKPKNEKPIVRLFDGVGEKFVLGKELLRESERVGMDLLEFKEELMQLPELGIVGFEELHEEIGGIMKDIEKGSILLDMDYIEPIAKNVTNLLKKYKKTGPSRKPRMKTTSSKVTPKIMEEHIVAAGLHKAFPDILGRVSCFENLNEMSNGNVFNVLLLLEHIQFVEVILNTKRIPKFLHQHEICTQHWTLCPYCTGIDLESSDSETESSEAENQDGEIQQMRKKISNQQQKILRLEITILKQKRTIQKLQRRVGK